MWVTAKIDAPTLKREKEKMQKVNGDTACTQFSSIFLINCWSSVVASVVLPQLCNLHCFFIYSFLLKEIGYG